MVYACSRVENKHRMYAVIGWKVRITPQHETSRSQLLSAGVVCHGVQAPEVRHDQGWKERTAKQLRRDKKRTKMQCQRGHKANDEKDNNGERVEVPVVRHPSRQSDSDLTSAGLLANPGVTKRWGCVKGSKY